MSFRNVLNILLFILMLPLIYLLLYTNLFNGHLFNPFYTLAQSFLQGRLDLNATYVLDAVSYNSKIYWHQGPLPALFLIPYVKLNLNLGLGWVYFFFNILVMVTLYFLVRKILKLSFVENLWFVFLFFFGSVYTGVAFEGLNWYYAQIITALFTLLTLNEYFGKRRFFLMGIYFGGVLATRIFGILGLFFFLFLVLFTRVKPIRKFTNLLLFIIPVLVVLGSLGVYNYLRFGSMWETGYNYATTGESAVVGESRKGGLFNLNNIPANFYWYFLKGPEAVYKDESDFKIVRPYLMPNPWGMSLFLVMPFFFTVFFKKWKNGLEKTLVLTIFIFIFMLLTYYTTGYRQYSARLVNDVLPYWFVLLLLQRNGQALSNKEKVFILIFALLNVYLVSAFKWYLYPEGGYVQVSHMVSPHGPIIRLPN